MSTTPTVPTDSNKDVDINEDETIISQIPSSALPRNNSAPDASSIQTLDKISIHRITSGQVIVDLQTAVKELVENSLDAGASSIGQSSNDAHCGY